MNKLVLRFLKGDSGVTSIEYALIASLISTVIVVAATTVGTTLQTTFNAVAGAL